MGEHPIEGLMITAMNSIKDMIDVDTIIGDAIETSNNTVIIPISKVGFGFAAGGSEFKGETINEYTKKEKEEEIQYRLPFGGGSGAGVSINPVAFLVIQQDTVKLLPVNHISVVDKLIDYVPDLIDKVNNMLNKKIKAMDIKLNEDKEKKQKDIKTNVEKPKTSKPKEKPKKVELDYEVEYDETLNKKPKNIEYILEEDEDE